MTQQTKIKNILMARIAKQWFEHGIIGKDDYSRLLEKASVSSTAVHPYVSVSYTHLTLPTNREV